MAGAPHADMPGREFPQTEVFEDLFYDVFGLNESDDGHRPMALGTSQGVNLIDFLNQSGPVLSIIF